MGKKNAGLKNGTPWRPIDRGELGGGWGKNKESLIIKVEGPPENKKQKKPLHQSGAGGGNQKYVNSLGGKNKDQGQRQIKVNEAVRTKERPASSLGGENE